MCGSLRHNAIGAEGGTAIADALRVNEALTSISLRYNGLGDEGWGAIFAGVCANKNSKIATIDASDESIGPAGAKLIGEALTTSVSEALTSLDTRYNSIGKEAALGLVTIFKEKDRMTFVGLASCELGAEGAGAVADYLRVSEALTEIEYARPKCGPNPNPPIEAPCRPNPCTA